MRSKATKNLPLRHVSRSVTYSLERSKNGMHVVSNQNLALTCNWKRGWEFMRVYLYVTYSTYENEGLSSATVSRCATLAPFFKEDHDPLWHYRVTRILCLSVIRSNDSLHGVIENVAEQSCKRYEYTLILLFTNTRL